MPMTLTKAFAHPQSTGRCREDGWEIITQLVTREASSSLHEGVIWASSMNESQGPPGHQSHLTLVTGLWKEQPEKCVKRGGQGGE